MNTPEPISKQLPRVGCWAAACCDLDLHQIIDEKDLLEHIEYDKDMEDDGLDGYAYWNTYDEAMAALVPPALEATLNKENTNV